jgi:hypothetical protein
LPSRNVTFTQLVGIFLRTRIGGSRCHSHAGSSMRSALAA